MGGISVTTGNYILYGTDGYLKVGNTDLGATIGDIAIEITTEEYYPDLMQARGPVAGTGRIISANGRMTVTLAEWQYAVLSTMYHVGFSSDASSETIGSGAVSAVNELDDIVVMGVTRNDGKEFRVTLDKGRVTSPIAFNLSESEVSGLEVTFEALYTLNSPATFPMYIEIAK